MILVEKVSFEKLLSGWVFQVNFIIFHGFSILPLLVVYVILVKVLAVLVGAVWSCYPVLL